MSMIVPKRGEAVSVHRTSTDAALLARAAGGDEKAFRQLYDRHVAAVYRYCRYMVLSAAEAEEASQETWIALWKVRASLELTTETLVPGYW